MKSANEIRAGFSASGVDVLGRHAYVASATWLVHAPERADKPAAARPDWNAAYAYDRWRPTVFVSAASNTRFSARVSENGTRPTPVTVRQQEFEAGVALPVRHIRASHRGLLSVVRTTDAFDFDTDMPSSSRSALRVGLSTSTAHTFGYSISPERGLAVGATAEFAHRTPGASAGTVTTTADARAYLPGLAEHHVLALRASGGVTSGPSGPGRVFLLGGAAASGTVLNFGEQAFSLMRGFPANRFAGSRIALLNADYRLPLARPQRGVGTWPIFLHSVHAALFGDVGEAWTNRFRAADLKTSLGGEIAVDLVAGYSFRLSTAAGVAWGHDAADGANRPSFYVRVGKAF